MTVLERLAEEEKRVSGLHIDEENWKRVLELEYHVPILKLLAMQCAEQSTSAEGTIDNISIEFHGNLVFKKYLYKGFLTN